MNLIVKLSVFFALVSGLVFIYVTPDPARQEAQGLKGKEERQLAQQHKFRADKQKILDQVIQYKKQADKWLDLTNNPKAYTGGGTTEYAKQVKLVAAYRPKIEQTRAKLYQVQRCLESSFSSGEIRQCKQAYAKIYPSRLRALSKVTLDEKQT